MCDTYRGGFNAAGDRDENGDDGDDDGVGRLLHPASSVSLPLVLEDEEVIVHVQDAERRRAMMIGTSSGRVSLVGIDALLAGAEPHTGMS